MGPDLDVFPPLQAILLSLVWPFLLKLQIVLIFIGMIFFPFMRQMIPAPVAAIYRSFKLTDV